MRKYVYFFIMCGVLILFASCGKESARDIVEESQSMIIENDFLSETDEGKEGMNQQDSSESVSQVVSETVEETEEDPEQAQFERELYEWMEQVVSNIPDSMIDSVTQDDLEPAYADFIEECKSVEMNVVLDHLGIAMWNSPAYAEEESDLPYDDFLGNYEPEKLSEYSANEYDIKISYIYGAWTQVSYDPPYKHWNMLIEEYNHSDLSSISIYLMQKGYFDLITSPTFFHYDVLDTLPVVEKDLFQEGRISGSGSLDGKFTFIYVVKNYEKHPYKSCAAYKVDCDISQEGLIITDIIGLAEK